MFYTSCTPVAIRYPPPMQPSVWALPVLSQRIIQSPCAPSITRHSLPIPHYGGGPTTSTIPSRGKHTEAWENMVVWPLADDVFKGTSSLTTESCHDANFVVTAGIAGCRYDNRPSMRIRQNQAWDNVMNDVSTKVRMTSDKPEDINS